MDITQTKELIGWAIGVLGVGVISLITGVYSIIKASKALPKELKGIDLENKLKELSLADQYDTLATKAAEKVIRTQERLDCLENDNIKLKDTLESLNTKIENQEAVVTKQAKLIEDQNTRLDLQEKKIKEQEEEIFLLRCELGNARKYNEALIKQMEEQKLIPISQEKVGLADCLEERKKKNGK